MERMMAAESPELGDQMLQDTNSNYQPGLTPALKLKPGYAPPQPLAPAPAPAPGFGVVPAPAPGFGVVPAPAPSYVPQPAYTPEPYTPPAPVGPVLLESKPYDPKSVEALPITVSETYTNFDCRSKPYPGRHYADVEAACEIYHFCHEDGKQDTFQCGYGTVFNEYIGTCDFKSSVQCSSGEGFAPAPAPYQPPVTYQQPGAYVAPAPAVVHHAPVVQQAHVVHSPPVFNTAPVVHPAPTPFVHTSPVVHSAPAPYVAQPATYQATSSAALPALPALPALKPFTNF